MATTTDKNLAMPQGPSMDDGEKAMGKAPMNKNVIGSDGLVKEQHWNDKGALDLEELVERITLILQNEKNIPLYKRKNIKQLMSMYDTSAGDWKKYAFFDSEKKYTRNLISTDDETYTLMLLCWNPNKESPIHDHPCENGCYMRAIQGNIQETRYVVDEESKAMKVTETNEAQNPEVVYIDDSQGFHKVGTMSPEGAVSLHLYSPPFDRCRCWMDENNADKVMHPVMTFYSEDGEVIDYENV